MGYAMPFRTVPGNETDVGGVKIVTHYQKELEESDTSSTSDADSSFKHEMGPLKLLSLAILYTLTLPMSTRLPNLGQLACPLCFVLEPYAERGKIGVLGIFWCE